MSEPSYLSLPGSRRIAYHLSEGKSPTVVFCGGFKSDMTGAKAMALEALCQARGQRFIRFDYTGHGQSSGAFKDGTISSWLADALSVIDALTHGPILIVGSSMGGWISLLAALNRPERIIGLVGIASAPDFTEALIWQQLKLEQQGELLRDGVFHVPSCYGQDPYPITRALIEDGRNHLLLHAPIPIHVPVRLLHGTRDEDVPYAMSQTLLEQLESPDAALTLIKNGDHRLSTPEYLTRICKTVEELL